MERRGRQFELLFGFVFIPLVVSTMDRAPLFLGGRILLWGGLYVLMSLQVHRDQGALSSHLRSVLRPSAYLPATALLLGIGSALQILFVQLGWWHPLGYTRPVALVPALMLLPLIVVTTAFPMEALLRAYLPQRFPGFASWFLPPFLTAWFYLGAWNWSTFLLALGGGVVLTLIARTRAPLWVPVTLHALGAWLLLCLRLP